MSYNGPSKGVDEKEGGGGEDTAEFALSLSEDGSRLDRQLKDLQACSLHSHRQNYLIFSLGVCILSRRAQLRPQELCRNKAGRGFISGRRPVLRVASLWSCARARSRPSTPPGSFAEIPSNPFAPTMALSSVTPLVMGGAFFSVGLNKQIARLLPPNAYS